MSSIQRCIVYPKDVHLMTGRSMYTVWKMFRLVRRTLGKTRYDLITAEEFCAVTGLNLVKLQRYLNIIIFGFAITPVLFAHLSIRVWN
jgi:hypothetical protein